jgi:TM2 domain-containing membrane protein YozV
MADPLEPKRPIQSPQIVQATQGYAAPRRIVNRSAAVLALIVNLFFPGLGSLIAGETGAGTGQLVLFIVGFPMMFFFVGWLMIPAAWIWALVTGIQLIVRSSG